MAFPDERDRNLIRRAEQVEHLATDLCDWLSEFNPARRTTDLLPIAESDEFEVLQLRRLAGSLYTSAKVPVAAAAYGASQVGKSLFMGQVLRPHSEDYCPIGGDETLAEPAYYKNLSFDNDLNPQCGSQEATALVTRFTTKDRIGASVSPELPGDGPGVDAGGVAAGVGPRFPCRVQDARPHLAAGRIGGAFRGHLPPPRRHARSIAAGGWTCWTPIRTCGRWTAAASRPRRPSSTAC